MTVLQTLAEMNDRLGSNNAPIRSQVIAMVFVIGVSTRDLAYVLVALAGDAPPQLRDDDVTLRSPVTSLDDASRWKLRIAARLLAVGLGVMWISIAGGLEHRLVATWLFANACVPLADPLLGLVNYLNTTR